MKAFLRGLLWGTIGTVVVLGLAIGVCYFSGLLDFAGGEREALSSSVQSTGFAVVGREAEGRAQEQEKPSAAPQEPLEAEVSLEPKEAKGEEIRLLFAGDLYLTELCRTSTGKRNPGGSYRRASSAASRGGLVYSEPGISLWNHRGGYGGEGIYLSSAAGSGQHSCGAWGGSGYSGQQSYA